MNHERPNTGNCKKYGIAFGEAILMSSLPSRSQICDRVACHRLDESGFGGWADEKIKNTPRSGSAVGPKKISSTTFDNTSLPKDRTYSCLPAVAWAGQFVVNKNLVLICANLGPTSEISGTRFAHSDI